MLAMAYIDFMGVVVVADNAQGYLNVRPPYFAERVCKVREWERDCRWAW